MNKAITNWNEVPVMMDLAFAARILAINVDYLSRLCKQGKIPAHKVGNQCRIWF